mmetsp:Transcript_45407/g.98535  ORF Transcript_45407/g.98535 Transcript_45407/m.98535 type:complete len:222 (+) Transcript_45407:185-850(+)
MSGPTATILLGVPRLRQGDGYQQQAENHDRNQNRILQILLEICPILHNRPKFQLGTRAFSGSVQRPAQSWRASSYPHGDNANGTTRINLRHRTSRNKRTCRLAITRRRTIWQSLRLHPACNQKLLRGAGNTVSHSRSSGCLSDGTVAQIGYHSINGRPGKQQRQLSLPSPRRGLVNKGRKALPIWQHLVGLDHQQIGSRIHSVEDSGWILLFGPNHNIPLG